MKDSEIVICGHGSGTPSLKNLNAYSESRYNQKASNGKRKGIACVKRLKTLTDAERSAFQTYYKSILGRNIYNQNLRSYVYTPYKDGKYYSDCSSSGCATYRKTGHTEVSLLNTAGIYNSSLFETVNVKLSNGHITNPEILKIGDAILFVGNDPDRPLQIGHVEFVYQIPKKEYSPNTWYSDLVGWWYAKTKDTYAKSEWMNINGHRYYFNDKGYAVTGDQTVDGKRYFFETSGNLECACMGELSYIVV